MARTEPALVRGNVRTAIAHFIEDSNGDLVDIKFECEEDAEFSVRGRVAALPWPCFEFSPDYATYCECGALIHNPSK